MIAAELGNTPDVCRKSYVHPAVVAAFSDGRLLAVVQQNKRRPPGKLKLRREETAVLALLERPAPQRAA